MFGPQEYQKLLLFSARVALQGNIFWRKFRCRGTSAITSLMEPTLILWTPEGCLSPLCRFCMTLITALLWWWFQQDPACLKQLWDKVTSIIPVNWSSGGYQPSTVGPLPLHVAKVLRRSFSVSGQTDACLRMTLLQIAITGSSLGPPRQTGQLLWFFGCVRALLECLCWFAP